jgi:ABC-type antimicrobial peptide transport system permease subunit
MAERYWQRKDPVGKRFKANGRWMTVVGVARDSKYRSLIEAPMPFFYVPVRQSAPAQSLEIRSSAGPDVIARTLVREVKALDQNLAPGEVITMREQVDRMSWSERAAVMLLGIFGGIALLLATIGLYGVVSYAVSQSTREFGLRMALGAETRDVLRSVLSQTFGLAGLGIALGAAVALASTRLMGDLLYRVNPRDPVTFAAAAAVMVAASFAACSLPAVRATRIDPAKALKEG